MLSFLFLGTFHWQRYEVTGITSSSSSADDVEDDVGCTLKFFAVIATSACNTAETCTAVFEKHNYQKQKKRRISITDFDLRPVECRGTAKALLPKLLESICGESLGVLVLFDPTYCHQTIPASHPDVPSNSAIKQTCSCSIQEKPQNASSEAKGDRTEHQSTARLTTVVDCSSLPHYSFTIW